MTILKAILVLLKDSFRAWKEDNAWRLGAALAFFTIFSLAPVLIIVLSMSGFIFGQEAAQSELVSQIRDLVGPKGASTIVSMTERASASKSNFAAGLFGIATLLFGASAVFVQLREAINTIWRIEEKPIGTIKGFVKARFLSFNMVLGIGFLLVVSLTISTILSAFGGFLGDMFPGLNKAIVKGLDFFISFAVITVLFALIFRILPNAKIKWRDIWVGSAFISLLFTIGKLAIGFYLGRSEIASTFGAASSLVIVMLWAFYSAQIFLFGAEFTKTYANQFGSNIEPDKNAVKIDIRKVELE